MGSPAAWEESRSRRPRDGVDRFGGEGGMGDVWVLARVWGRPHVQCIMCVYVRACARVKVAVGAWVWERCMYVCEESMI